MSAAGPPGDSGAAGPAGAAGSGAAGSGPPSGAAPDEPEREWLLLIDPEDLPERHAAVGAEGPFQLALLDLQRALRNTGHSMTVLTLPSEGADLPAPWIPSSSRTPGPAMRLRGRPEHTILVVVSPDLESLLLRCERARALRIGAQGAALLACLLPPQEYLPPFIADAAERARGAGADDLLLGSPPVAELLTRASTVLYVAAQRRTTERLAGYQQALQRALALLGDDPGGGPDAADRFEREENAPVVTMGVDSSDGSAQRFYQLVDLARSTLGCACVALARVDAEGGSDAVVIVTASQDAEQICLSAPLAPYPQLRAALSQRHPQAITDGAERARLGAPLRLPADGTVLVMPLPSLLADSGPRRIESGMVVSPEARWALILFETRPTRTLALDEPALGFLRSLAQLTALGVRGRNLDDTMRDRTRRLRIRQQGSEHRRQSLYHYREFFETSADGVIILDDSGRIIWLNRAAEQVTGYAAEGLSGHLLAELIPDPQRDGLLSAVAQVLGERKVPSFDLPLITTSRETLTLSVSTSALLVEQQRYVVIAFRDVTEKRALENELRKTKEFQERLIDSTVDGIIAADLRGRVLLFNQGAARITGYAPDEVIGKVPVWQLYPDDDAREIMRQLRSDEFGGRGRLLQSRRTLVGKNGQPIPVALTASIIYAGDVEDGTVGIVADLRDRLRMEQRLIKTEERLAVSEKQALVVELAGTAAHELNQPLTSMMGYAELLRRRLPDGYAEILGYADILVREAERMAEIVRKIGRITRYETKTYVGDARILDLDKSVQPDGTAEPASALLIGRPDSGPPGTALSGRGLDLRDAPLFQKSRVIMPPRPAGDDGDEDD